MEFVSAITVFLYLASTVAYCAYLIRQKDGFYQTGLFCLIGGFTGQSASLIYAFVKAGEIPVRNLYETLWTVSWAIVLVFLVLQYTKKIKILGIYTAPLATMLSMAALRMPVEPLETANVFKSVWLFLHILFIFTGEAAFALACGTGILYLIQERAIKLKKRGFFYRRLPSLELLDSVGHACIVFGFTLMTVGLITGFVYAKSIWGKFWSMDPKEVWSCITWLLYAALLHERLAVGWRGRRAAILAIVGFCAVLFTFFGANFIFKGHHEAFTRW
jgi:cytochrome c-type biogenesis protein CcsB